MYVKVLELNEPYFLFEEHFQIDVLRKLKMKTYTIKNIFDATLSLNFEREVSVWSNRFFILKRQLDELYKNAYVVNYLPYSYSNLISVVTTFIFIFDFNIVSINENKNRIRVRKWY